MSDQERVDFYKKQIGLEDKIVEKANESVRNVKNLLVRELIEGIAMDSKKHASMLNALVAMHTKSTPLLQEEITDELEKNLKEHIALEQEAIDTYQELYKKDFGESEKLIVKAILNDELRHHALLKKIHKMIVEKETLTEQDLWDWVWKDSLFHGSPGG
ncbi:MAG: ferritin family protein [Candidatus Hodarchaeales archaeon]